MPSEAVAPSPRSDSEAMFLRRRRIMKSPRTNAETEQTSTTAARSSTGLARTLTRASRTSAESDLRRTTQTEPCCPEKLRKASDIRDRPAEQTARHACEQ